jgi:hypothetical protein
VATGISRFGSAFWYRTVVQKVLSVSFARLADAILGSSKDGMQAWALTVAGRDFRESHAEWKVVSEQFRGITGEGGGRPIIIQAGEGLS